MNHDLLIKATNWIAFYAAIALIYWVFIFLTITVFDLRIFRERMTEMFFLSLLGIFAVLGGSIILNIMSNLSKISAAVSASIPISDPASAKNFRLYLLLFLFSFPLLVTILFAGNELSSQRRKNFLIASAEKIISENQPLLATLSNYQFSINYMESVSRTLTILNKIDKHFPEIMVIIPDTIDGKNLFLGFSERQNSHLEKDNKLEKSKYIYSTSKEERDYLEQVFAGRQVNYKFNTEKGSYRLYFPTTVDGRKIVLYFSDFQRYGKLGS